MAEPPSNAIRNAVLGAVATAAVGALFALAPSAWLWVSDKFKAAGIHMQGSTPAPNWLLYFLGACTVYCLWKMATRVLRRFQDAEEDFRSYTEDQFFNARWRWAYAGGVPRGIWAFCLRCDTQLVYSEARNYGENLVTLSCEHCNSPILSEAGDKDYLVAKVARQIDRKLRNGDWKANLRAGAA